MVVVRSSRGASQSSFASTLPNSVAVVLVLVTLLCLVASREPYLPDAQNNRNLRGGSANRIARMLQEDVNGVPASVSTDVVDDDDDDDDDDFVSPPPDEEEPFLVLYNVILALTCVCVAALAAGLTMGMMSLDPLLLAIKLRSGNAREREQASRILPLIRQHHFLLVTLLLLNSIANESLPLFLDKLVPSYVAVILSVTFVLFFGEIIPSAVFTGPDQMGIAAALVPMVRVVMTVLAPIAYPISVVLDKVLHDGDEGGDGGQITEYNREELSALVRIQYEHRVALSSQKRGQPKMETLKEEQSCSGNDGLRNDDYREKKLLGRTFGSAESDDSPHQSKSSSTPRGSLNSRLSPRAVRRRNTFASPRERIYSDEVDIVEGALTLTKKTVMDACVPLRTIYALDRDTILDIDAMARIYASGYSRIPVVVDMTRKIHATSYYQLRDQTVATTLGQKQRVGNQELRTELAENVSSVKEEEDKSSICGILMARQLILLNPNDNRPLSTMPLVKPICVGPDISVLEMMNIFVKSGCHMAVICQNPSIATLALKLNKPIPNMTAGVLGIITFEDVLEQLLKEEIYDESDLRLRRMSSGKLQGAMEKWKEYVDSKKLSFDSREGSND